MPERRLDEERLQIEAKKKEREEQHLYLTAKVCNKKSALMMRTRFLTFYRLSPTRRSVITRDST